MLIPNRKTLEDRFNRRTQLPTLKSNSEILENALDSMSKLTEEERAFARDYLEIHGNLHDISLVPAV